MFRVLLLAGFLSTISCVIAGKTEEKEIGKALIAYAVTVHNNGTKLLNETNLSRQTCSNRTYCEDGYQCCSTTTCCPVWRKCCGGGTLCCSSATTARSTVGLIAAALLLYLGASLVKSKN